MRGRSPNYAGISAGGVNMVLITESHSAVKAVTAGIIHRMLCVSIICWKLLLNNFIHSSEKPQDHHPPTPLKSSVFLKRNVTSGTGCVCRGCLRKHLCGLSVAAADAASGCLLDAR